MGAVGATREQQRRISDLAEEVADLAGRHGLGVAAVESLTGGAISSALGAAPSSSEWYRGTVVAYSPRVKYELMGVPEGPVVTEECARCLVTSGARMLLADAAVAVTGVGGPDDEEGHAPGTVWFGVTAGDGVTTRLEHLDGDPEEIVHVTAIRALELLRDALRALGAD
jgi:nicotinamide-nucleotide amidase